MGIIKIRNYSIIDDSEAVRLVASVISEGRISNVGRSYCYATLMKHPRVMVTATANKDSDRFDVQDVPEPPRD